MHSRQHLKIRACEALEKPHFDFQAKLFAAQDLFFIVRGNPSDIDHRSLSALKRTLLSRQFERQRQRLFLYREVAHVFGSLMAAAPQSGIARKAFDCLHEVLLRTQGSAHQAAAEALGRLPADVKAQSPAAACGNGAANISWERLLAVAGLSLRPRCDVRGRSLVLSCDSRSDLLVVKFARCRTDAENLRSEARWMQHLRDRPPKVALRFDIPEPLSFHSSWVLKIRNLPPRLARSLSCDVPPCGIAFRVSAEYFSYPNPFNSQRLPRPAVFEEVIVRNAHLLGAMTAGGIGHDAPIALFHNRVQQERRRDLGRYEWYRGGRLDRWLASCRYPNFGFSGLRDFEHFVAIDGRCGDLMLYRLIGQHLLSLALVMGSYFRAKEPRRIGWDDRGQPVDARDLFDGDLLQRWLGQVFRAYYLGFVGRAAETDLPFDCGLLARRMIDEMGVDRYMEEVLRSADQQRMSSFEFAQFLSERGFGPDAVARIDKGRADLIVRTGPHLGAFNRPISLPELIDAVSAMGAACVSGRFFRYH